MATNLIEVQQFLNEDGLNYQVEQSSNSVLISFPMTDYTCPKTGSESLLIVVALDENGEYIQVFAPFCFSVEGVPFPEAAKSACLEFCYKTKLLQVEYDPEDGEIRMIIEFPLEDSNLTSRQLLRCVHSLKSLVDDFAPLFHQAASTGECDWTAVESATPGSLDRMELADLVQAAGGVEGLRKLLSSR